MMRWYSSSVSPSEAACATVTSDAHRALEQAADDGCSVGAVEPDGRIDRVFGVRHHPEHVPLFVADPSDAVGRPIGVGALDAPPVEIAIAEDDLALRVHLLQLLGIGDIPPFPVLDGNDEDFALVGLEQLRNRALDDDRLRAANELQA